MKYAEEPGSERERERYLILERIDYMLPDGNGELNVANTDFSPLDLSVVPDRDRVWALLKDPETPKTLTMSVTADTAEFIGMMFLKAARITRGEEPWDAPEIGAEI